jgi:L-ascorbate metabolism protein UlaG (beta-lactamase superfamily)
MRRGPSIYGSQRGMQIEYVIHASLFVRASKCNLLTDPFYFFDPFVASFMCHFPPRDLTPSDFGVIDYLYSSHIHPDHSHPDTLKLLKESVRHVILPAERPDLEDRFRGLGFTDIRLLENAVPVQLEDGLEVTSYWSDPVDTTLVVRAGDVTLLHGNDCLLDQPTLKKIAENHRVNYAFINSTSVQFIHPMLLPRPDEELKTLAGIREDAFFRYQMMVVNALNPDVVIPYSMTMTYYLPDQIKFNGYERLIPPTFCERLQKMRPAQQCWILQPGDVIETESMTVVRGHEHNYWGKDLASFLENVQSYAAEIAPQRPPFSYGLVAENLPSLLNFLTARVKKPIAPELQDKVFDLRLIGDDGEAMCRINFGNGLVQEPASSNGNSDTFMHIEIPASLIGTILSKVYDPFSILFTYRVKFQLLAPLNLRPDQESELYIKVFESLLAA